MSRMHLAAVLCAYYNNIIYSVQEKFSDDLYCTYVLRRHRCKYIREYSPGYICSVGVDKMCEYI